MSVLLSWNRDLDLGKVVCPKPHDLPVTILLGMKMNATTDTHLAPPSQATIDLIMKSVTTTSSAANRRSAPRRTPRGNVSVELRKGSMGLGPNLAILFL